MFSPVLLFRNLISTCLDTTLFRITNCVRVRGAMSGSQDGAHGSCISVLRGVPVWSVLRGGGKLFDNSRGTERTFRLSSEVSHIDTFISHTWSTPRWRKTITLCMQYNFSVAYLSAVTTGVVIAGLTSLDLLPLMPVFSNSETPYFRTAPYATVSCWLVFFIVLYGFADVASALRLRSPVVFLDKACIHQADERAKARGIMNLGVFTFFSRNFVIVESDEYLERRGRCTNSAALSLLSRATQFSCCPQTRLSS